MQEIVEGADIVYSYDVEWVPSNIRWASRWDAYLRMPGGNVSQHMGMKMKSTCAPCFSPAFLLWGKF